MPLRVLSWLVSRLPLGGARGLGAVLGWIWFHVMPIRRATVLAALGERLGMAPPEAWRTAAGVYRELGISAMELLWLRPDGRHRLERLVRVEGTEHFDRARARGRGVIVVTAHFGNWDVMACSQAARAAPLHVVTKRLSIRWIDRFWQAHRGAFGVQLHDVGSSARPVLRALRAGETVALVVDQDTPPARGGIFVPFLGAQCATPAAPAVLAARTGAALVPVRCEREPGGMLRVLVEPELEPKRAPGGRVDVEATMRCVNERIESWVRTSPTRWLWLHRRWKTRPSAAVCSPAPGSVPTPSSSDREGSGLATTDSG